MTSSQAAPPSTDLTQLRVDPLIAWGNTIVRRLGVWAMFLYTVCVYGFLFAPIIIVIVMSFNSARFSAFPLEQFTLGWYRDLFSDRTIWEALKNSLIVATGTVALAVRRTRRA
jgi:ABC-type spermidine/putrescine transport system permease subunit II